MVAIWNIVVNNNKKVNAEWITAEHCKWDLSDFEDKEFTIIDELMIQVDYSQASRHN